YGIFVLDEAHYARNLNKQRAGCVELTVRSRMSIALTATPVMTGPMDLVNIAKWLELPGIVNSEMARFKRELDRARRKEREKRQKGKGDVRLARVVALGQVSKDAIEDKIKQANHDWIAAIRVIYKGYMMRRTIYSKDNRGKPISGLAPWVESSLLVNLTEEEMEVQRELAAQLAQEGVSVDSKGVGVSLFTLICSRNTLWEGRAFYLSIRQALLHPGFSKLSGYAFTPEDELKPYTDHPSTKIDAVLSVLEWHLGHCCRPPLEYNTDSHVYSQVDAESWPWDPKRDNPDGALPNDKIIVYLAFPSLNWLIKSAFEQRGIHYQEINGLVNTAQRSAALLDFRTNPECNVLLLSGVGMCGLNMAFANIVIIVDNLWSAQEDQQLIGRVWRYSQPKIVAIYRIIARGTSDVFLNNIGFQKGTLHSEFSGIEPSLRTSHTQGQKSSG
ncbi:P-loop containing nucleoside triphosphate hydrolase protein, partial [Lenzites betulinus]